ncbi:hypothetical protein NX059_007038 [Plenodomus lindquistii]|nr:hypothetical protein NX059_007038 [Plenodomus lindquistii]
MSASFWARAGDIVKSTSSPSPNFTQPPPKRTAIPTKTKNGCVLRPMTNGAVQSPVSAVNGKMSWADSEDDDEFLASFDVRKDPAITSLEGAVSRKDARIEELEAHVGTSTVRMEQLEASSAEKDARISRLKAATEDDHTRISELTYFLKEKDSRISDMEKNIKLQSSHVQELVAEVDEKDRCIADLEKELDDKGAIIRNLEAQTDSNRSAPAPEIADIKNTPQQEPATTACNDPTMPEEPGSESSFEVVNVPTLREANEDPTPTHIPTIPDHPTSTDVGNKLDKTAGPTFGNTDFPIFATQETLKVVPPAPAPKKLTFPINWDKYNNKKPIQIAPVPTEKKYQAHKHGKVDTSPVMGLAAKAKRDPSAEAPEFNPSLDIRQMSPAKRLAYANGPQVAIIMGDITLGSLPKFMAMQCSGKAYKHFNANPQATSFVLPAKSMDLEAAKLHLNWMDEMGYQGRVYSVTLNTDPKHDAKNLHICRAARILGLNNTYVGHFTKQLCDRIRNNEASTEFMDLACALAVPDNDPIFDCLANNLVTQRVRKAAEFDADVVVKLEAKYPALAKKMGTIAARLGGKHQKGGSRGGSIRASSSAERESVVR